jgi:hypothetical protein
VPLLLHCPQLHPAAAAAAALLQLLLHLAASSTAAAVEHVGSLCWLFAAAAAQN